MIEAADLAGLPLFEGVEPLLMARVMARAADVRANAGEYVVNEGDRTGFYVLLEGVLEVTKVSSGREAVLAERHARGDYFGEIPMLLEAPALANLRAKTAARMAKIEAQEFRWLYLKSPKFRETVTDTMCERIGGLQESVLSGPTEVVAVVGKRWDPACHNVRDFLQRNQVTYEYFELGEPCAKMLVPEADALGDVCPIVKVPGRKELLLEPSLREVADAVGLTTKPLHKAYDVVIVGGGPAGFAAAVYGATEGLQTLLVEEQAPGGQTGTSSRIENYLGFPTGVAGDDLMSRAYRQARRFEAEVIVTRRVIGIEPGTFPAAHTVVLDGNERVAARAILLANGIKWRKLPVPDVEKFTGAGIYYGAARTEAPATRGREIYLIGAGNSAGQAAMHFSNYASKVTLLVRGDSLEAAMSTYLIEEMKSRANIFVELESEVVGVHGGAHLEAIDVLHRPSNATTRRETSFVFVFIGAETETDWLPSGVGRDSRGYVVTGLRLEDKGRCELMESWPLERDPFHLESSVPGIFAAGDVRADSVKRCASGVGEGSMAIAFVHQYLGEAAKANVPGPVLPQVTAPARVPAPA